MNSGIEKRRDPRVPLVLPVVLMTPQGAIEGKTANISVSGLALLLFLEKPEIGDEFEITIKSSDDHEMSVTCEKVWSDTIILDESVYYGIGVQFTKISANDREILASMVAEYQTL